MLTATVIRADLEVKIEKRVGTKVVFYYTRSPKDRLVIDMKDLSNWYRNMDALPTTGWQVYFLHHQHKCKNPECGYIWGHEGKEAALWKAHNCPRCERTEYCVYFEDRPEDCSRV